MAEGQQSWNCCPLCVKGANMVSALRCARAGRKPNALHVQPRTRGWGTGRAAHISWFCEHVEPDPGQRPQDEKGANPVEPPPEHRLALPLLSRPAAFPAVLARRGNVYPRSGEPHMWAQVPSARTDVGFGLLKS